MFKGIFFDLGLTLVYPSTAKDAAKLLREMGFTIKQHEVEKAFSLADGYFFCYHPGVLNQEVESFFPWYSEVLLKLMGLDICVEKFVKRMLQEYPPRRKWLLYEDTVPTLEELRERGLYLGLITNWDTSARKIMEEKDISKYFQTIVVSGEEGVEKPDPLIFQRALDDSGLLPHQLLYVGDNYWDDIKGAKGVGVKGILIQRHPVELGENGYDCPLVTDLYQLLKLTL